MRKRTQGTSNITAAIVVLGLLVGSFMLLRIPDGRASGASVERAMEGIISSR